MPSHSRNAPRAAPASRQPASGRWPKIGYETCEWAPKISRDLLTQAQRNRYLQPYRAAVVPLIGHLRPPITAEVAALADEATVDIARFDNEFGHEVIPFSSIFLRSESAASSQIENLSSGAKAIALAELGSAEKRNATEIVGNVDAMKAALALADRLDSQAILRMHEALVARHDPEIAGKWRAEQVWIGGTAIGPHEAMFIPPRHERVPRLMGDLVDFAVRTDVPTLVQAAVAHAQFETIHPFPDGNGRTGRALVHSILRRRGITENITVPVSAGLLTDTRRYFDTLTAYREGNPSPIVEMLAHASSSAIANARHLVADLRRIRQGWESRIKQRRDAAAWRLVDLVLRQPVVDARTIASGLSIRADNAQRPVRPLVEAGVLSEFTGFGRNRMWQAREVIDALDAFALRAGRRAAT